MASHTFHGLVLWTHKYMQKAGPVIVATLSDEKWKLEAFLLEGQHLLNGLEEKLALVESQDKKDDLLIMIEKVKLLHGELSKHDRVSQSSRMFSHYSSA